MQQTIVIVGGGYAGISFAEQVRSLEKQKELPPSKIILYSYEPFCSRPNLFFRYKFLQWPEQNIDFGYIVNQKQNFYEKNAVDLKMNSLVTKIDFENQMVYSNNQEAVHFDKLILATGGLPNFVNYPLAYEESSLLLSHKRSMIHAASVEVKNLLQDKQVQRLPHNMFVVRNIEEIREVYHLVKSLYEKNHQKQAAAESQDETDILVIGSGALAIDIVSSILDGYVQIIKKLSPQEESKKPAKPSTEVIEWSVPDASYLPKIKIIARRADGLLGHSLFKDDDACKIINNVALHTKPYEQYLSIISGDSVREVVCHSEEDPTVTGVVTEAGRKISCSVVIQAVGVDSNTKIALENNIELGPKKGILVNGLFECTSSNTSVTIPKGTVFAVGDCAELPTTANLTINGGGSEEKTVVWKNWTSSREQASELAKILLDEGYQQPKLWFNQTTRMFGLYVACHGSYTIQKGAQGYLVLSRQNLQTSRFLKLVFKHLTETEVKLVGALMLGPEMKDYMQGQQLLEMLTLNKTIPLVVANDLIEEGFQLLSLLKLLRTNAAPEALLSAQQKGEFKTAPVASKVTNPVAAKKFVNPIANKKKAAATTTAATSTTQEATAEETSKTKL